MTSSTSSSSSRRALLALLAAAAWALPPPAAAQAPAEPAEPAEEAPLPVPPREPGALARVAVFPVENLSGAAIGARELRGAVELALARRGLDVIGGDLLERFLARHRIRYTGGIDAATSAAAARDLDVDGVVVSSLDFYDESRPSFGMTMRLVSGPEATVRWIDGVAQAGDESPGLLGLGIVREVRTLRDRVLARLGQSLADALQGKGPSAPPCPDGRRFRPKVRSRTGIFAQDEERLTVAVVPFRNLSRRRFAGEAVALTFARQLASMPGLTLVEPGVVRDVLLRQRIVMEGGVSLDQLRTLHGALGVDLLVAGDVFDYTDAGGSGAPTANFTVSVLDDRAGRVLWQSTSYNQGDDGVFFFDAGKVGTVPRLACRMARSAVEQMVSAPRRPAGAADPQRKPDHAR
ncbi:hypothetical protein [Anaeromyxobacter diazotrophicus]|uniref:Lipoprotein n=1 Tax=Anaeromyxobacter diazotrophicus TaxID=2590199 RepID=A0A7I9VLK6_9BACT|nr:hypothetical protein [Anaeromyxobacter diazotrophicus]GEJ57078.1 lipoprotein [Anaeromyxobacter diazotrophicus]